MQSAAPHVLARAGPPAHRRAGPPQAAAEAREAGFEHVNLDLIYGTPGETRRRLRRLAGGGDRRRGRPRQRVLADRRGRHPAGRPDRAAASCRTRRRRGRRPLPGRRGGADRGRLRAGTRCPTGPPTAAARCRHNLLYWPAATGGVGPGRAQPRRRGALVERQAPRARTRSAWPSGARPAHGREMLDRRRAAHRGRDAAAAAGRRAAAGRAGRRPAGSPRSGARPTGCWTEATTAAAPC